MLLPNKDVITAFITKPQFVIGGITSTAIHKDFTTKTIKSKRRLYDDFRKHLFCKASCLTKDKINDNIYMYLKKVNLCKTNFLKHIR